MPLPGAAMLAGVNVAVMPLGNPLIDNATAALNPLPAALVIVIGVEAPGATLGPVALDERVKLAGGKTVSANVRVLVVFPPTAPRVRLWVPAAAAELTDKVRMLCPLPGAAMLVGERLAVTPEGSPLMER